MSEISSLKEIPLMDYWRIVVRRRWVVALFATLLAGTTTINTLRQPREYQASTVVHIDMAPPRVVDWDDAATVQPRGLEYQAFYNTQYQIISSRGVKANAITRLRSKGYHEWDSDKDPVAAFTRNLVITPVKDTRLVSIGYLHTDPNKAAEIANTVADVYIDENINRKLRTAQRAEAWLAEQADEYVLRKKKADEDLLKYREDNELLAERWAQVLKNLTSLNDQLTAAHAERMAAENEYKLVAELYRKGDLDPLISYFSTNTINSLKEQYNAVDRQYVALSARYLPRYPTMLQLDEERQTLLKKLKEELTRLVRGKEAEFTLRKTKEDAVAAEYAAGRTDAADVEKRLVGAQTLQNESETIDRIFKQLNKRQAETDLVSLLKNSNIEIIDQAFPPVSPSRPNVTLNVVLGVVIGLVGGVALAFGLEYLDKTFKSPDEVEQYLGVRLLGVLPILQNEEESQKRDTFVFRNPNSTIAECVRSMRTKLMIGNADLGLHTVLVTSASPREGKSTVVVSLAITMALANQKTLIVDTDLRRPRLHHVFGVPLGKGVTSILDGSSTYEESILPTEVPNLFFLPAGPIPPNPAELMGGSQMELLLAELERRFDFIVMDSPPCIAVTDAVVLGHKIDGVIFVIKQESTTKEAAREALRRLSDIRERLLGCVINQVDIDRNTYGYKYYYYYHAYGEENT